MCYNELGFFKSSDKDVDVAWRLFIFKTGDCFNNFIYFSRSQNYRRNLSFTEIR